MPYSLNDSRQCALADAMLIKEVPLIQCYSTESIQTSSPNLPILVVLLMGVHIGIIVSLFITSAGTPRTYPS